ncbi:hypothetical protein POV27_11990 [Aureisphaera galaxeae]|uniref:hypothetical protein n=1 Tax=Aureisphaera galaxeae TaxID=1538023 RepID=UPI00234FBE29|nr:hypothetical protein [Aureisphaera galaxeae]MDC8004775.1 hypothetical protein [Aureisphaera galaxeae]
MKKLIPLLALLLVLASCKSDDDGSSMEEDAQALENLFSEIEAMANAVSCKDPALWTYTEVGAKACGGPQGFVPYAANMANVNLFLERVEEHRQAERNFNEKWGIISDCSLPAEPSGVECQNGEAVLIYN